MKIRAFVSVVAPAAKGGKSIEIPPDGVGDVREDKARYLINEGYAEKVSNSIEETATPYVQTRVPVGPKKKTNPRAARKQAAVKAPAETDANPEMRPPTARSKSVSQRANRTRRTRAELLGEVETAEE